jgi:hypothetical protein
MVKIPPLLTVLLRGLLEGSWQSKLLAHLAHCWQDLFFHQLETSHCVFMANGTVVGPHTENTGTKYLEALADLLDDSLGTADYHAIAFDHLIPACGVNTAVKRVGAQRVLVLFQ